MNATADSVEPLGVSVVIVNWNTRERVLHLLRELTPRSESATNTDGRAVPLELIVVDNHSSDDSAAAIRSEFPDVKLLEQATNRGFAGGVNPGVALATMPLVLLLNSDTETTREAISNAASYMAQEPNVGILGPQILGIDGKPEASSWRDPSLGWLLLGVLGLNKVKWLNFERYRERVVREPTDVDCVCGAVLMVRGELFQELGGLDEDFFMYFEETDLCLRARQNGKRVHHAPVGTFVHDKGGTSRSVRLRTFLDFRRSQILFHRKHGGTISALTARGLLVAEAAIRIPPLLVLAAVGGSRRDHARTRLNLNLRGLLWLLNPKGGLVPEVDRSG